VNSVFQREQGSVVGVLLGSLQQNHCYDEYSKRAKIMYRHIYRYDSERERRRILRDATMEESNEGYEIEDDFIRPRISRK
jgi:hypothetical protein